MPATRPTNEPGDRDGAVFESTDPECTEQFLTAAFGSSVKISGDLHNYRFRIARLGTGPLHITTVDHTPTTEARADPMPDHFAVVRMRRGVRTNVDLDEHLGPGDLTVHAQPGQPVHLRMNAARHTAVFIPIVDTADAARNRPDDNLGPLRFHSLRPVQPAAARRWLGTVDYVADCLRANPGAMDQPLLRSATTALLAASLLSTFPNTWVSEPHHHDRTGATPTTLSRAIAFIETNAHLDISIVDVARAAYVTVRAVQLAFRRHLDTTPMTYLRRVRLERAHKELSDANLADRVTITATAARWGFADPSRFTALYRRAYGELPSQTLHT